MKKYPSVIFDFETICNKPTAKIVSLSAVIFDEHGNDDFKTMINDVDKTFNVKVSTLSGQDGRSVSKGALDFWAKQDKGVQSILKPSPDDVELKQTILMFKEFLDRNNVCQKNSLGYVRGQSFDFPVMSDIVDTLFSGEYGEYGMFPVAFWNQRDIRTAISFSVLAPTIRKIPVQKGTFQGFEAHNSLHDCCKDAILLQIAIKYGDGSLEIPEDTEMF